VPALVILTLGNLKRQARIHIIIKKEDITYWRDGVKGVGVIGWSNFYKFPNSIKQTEK
jgi:hypothetical protein